jgi:LmbE family N-acetylglucosaminyl deacetylase
VHASLTPERHVRLRSSVQYALLLASVVAAPTLHAQEQSSAGARRMRAAGPPVLEAFVVAHPDDWQLFMGDVAVRAVRSGAPVVFMVLTAGDAGRPVNYWGARERGAIASMLVARGEMPSDSAARFTASVRPAMCAAASVSGQRVHRCALGNTVSYFLRLPDGNLDATGFAATGRIGLTQLERGTTPSLGGLDGGARVGSWATLAALVGDVLQLEATRARVPALAVRVHAQDPDSVRNPDDHADHRAAARLMATVATDRTWGLTQYADYSVSTRPVNLSADAFAAKAAVFLAYDRTRILADSALSAYAESPRDYSAWLSRTYAHVARAVARHRGRR